MMFVRSAFVVAALTTSALASATVLVAQHRATDLTGNWTFSVITENGTGTPAVTMKQQGDSLSGTYESSRMGVLAFKGRVKDRTFTFDVGTSGGTTLSFKGTIVDDDHVKGDVDFGGQGSAMFTGERRR